ncbi:Replication protein A 70 kDa DNA-binding subunit B [Vitis vinifera]|uniref:Replication protein A 70 kDa DNA-binding subunit B n=1 Tax=Vitis vinifera TaxID=29760 RepID=A0A438CPQ9_VITVI|nr:Replication protein A 70 kDa DNA-binding subunit B [Vitis vinifera]
MDPYVNGKERVYVSGVVQSVSPTMRIRRKSDNDIVPKRDITFADKRKKTVVVSLWNDHATNVGQELLDNADKFPIVAIKSLKVGDFQGASMASIGSDISPSSKGGVRSMYYDRVSLSHVTSNPYLGEDKPSFFSIRAYISFIKPDQTMWYRACKTCNKKVTGAIGSGYWCEGCQKNDDECSLRYIMVVKVSDASGEAWLSMFNEQAERIFGCSADEPDKLK